MKKFLKLTLFSLWFVSISRLYCNMPIELGKHDGGEYCYRIPGASSGRMYPDINQYQNFSSDCDRSGDRPGQSTACSCQVEQTEEIDPNYWNDRVMNFEEVRNLFPIFKTAVNGHPFIYFDSASTAQMPQPVIDAIVEYYQSYKSNVGRGLYLFAEKSTKMFEDSRAKVARFIGAKKEEIVFTPGATAGINLVVHIWADGNVQTGDEIIVSEVEHNANFIPWQQLAQKKGAVLKIVPVTQSGVIDPQVLQTYLSRKTKLVAITHQSNILGTTNDVAEIAKISHAVGAKVLVDAAQSIAHQTIDVKALDCDFLVFSGHKLYGPTGVGVLFVKQELFKECKLSNFGGGIAHSVTPTHIEFKDFPHVLEPGTQAIAQVIGLAAAIDFVQKNINFDQVQRHETELVIKLATALQKCPNIVLISPIPNENQHCNMVTFCVNGCHAYDLAEHLDKFGIAVRAGFHCVQPYHDKLGGNASVRVSFSAYNTHEQVDFLIECLKSMQH